jgi:ornithine cyclodeaminase
MGAAPLHAFAAAGCTSAQTCVKSGYIDGDNVYVVKIAPGGFVRNPERGLGSSNTGMMLVFSQRSGRLEAILFDEGLLTELRTAAAGALAAQLFAPPTVRTIGIVGAGIQARWQLRLLRSVVAPRAVRRGDIGAIRVLVHARGASGLALCVEEMRREGWDAEACAGEDGLERLARASDVVVCTTPSRRAILKAEWFGDVGRAGGRPGALVTAVGADAPGKQELEAKLVAAADALVCDSLAQTAERGEFQHAMRAGLVDAGRVREIGAVLAERRAAADPTAAEGCGGGLTVFDSSGVAVQDVVISKMALLALRRRTSSGSSSGAQNLGAARSRL